MKTLAFLHTAEVHVATFDALVADRSDEPLTVRHLVRADLLAEARRIRAEHPDIETALRSALTELADADVVVCTCSTLSGVAEGLDDAVVRIDRPLAEAALADGTNVVVAVAVESTLGPTTDLFAEVAAQSPGQVAQVTTRTCEGAWDLFEQGDIDAYHRSIADDLSSLPDEIDIIVLGQASMAPAADLVEHRATVLSSPPLAVDRALSILADDPGTPASPRTG